MVERFPERMPLISPLTARIGGKRARIQGATSKRGLKRFIRPPAKRPMMLKEKARRAWTKVERLQCLLGPASFRVAPLPQLP
ncbi:hypothetical protein DRO56_04735 [Candidatus Bathyarchaeota archaeon]|nr:MAG: hypothetical protein DRO56_04735 [Candidatus Bathyarchaeota archaeon]